MKRVIGYTLLVLSFIAWGGIALLPFVDVSKAQVAGVTAFLVVVGELLFWLAIVFLGKEAWEKIKGFFKRNQ